ncbi:MAG TPA: hypothetical protein PKI46_07885 [Bacteroidales bacterium]|nr:hypothetical protein [Bacteroidales bacterium]
MPTSLANLFNNEDEVVPIIIKIIASIQLMEYSMDIFFLFISPTRKIKNINQNTALII